MSWDKFLLSNVVQLFLIHKKCYHDGKKRITPKDACYGVSLFNSSSVVHFLVGNLMLCPGQLVNLEI